MPKRYNKKPFILNFLKTAADYIGIGLVALGAIIVYASIRGNFNLYIFGTGILLITVPIAVHFIIEKTRNTSGPKPKLLSDLKHTGIRVTVDLTRCVVQSNNWTTKVDKGNLPKVAFFNEVSGRGDLNEELIEANLSIVEYKCNFNGKRRTFQSPPIAKDKTTVTLLLEIQKESAIYVDRDDQGYYYFDLEFIE